MSPSAPPAHPSSEPLIVDSWLVEDGLVLGLDLHEERFRGACAELLPSIDGEALDRVFAGARAMTPREGRWFPRVEAYSQPRPDGALGVLMRHAPPRAQSISLWVPPRSDPRAHPTVKGPDLGPLDELDARGPQARRRARPRRLQSYPALSMNNRIGAYILR